MVEREDGLIEPPRRERPPRHSTGKRLAAIAGVLVVLGVGAFLAVRFVPRSSAPPQPTTVAAPKPFRVVFPEGFTRVQMAQRVEAVAGIAHRERGVDPRLSARTYLAATSAPRRIPGFGPKRLPLEGFLFPATYDFLAKTTSRQLVAAQLVAFQREWGTVQLAYARSKRLTPYDVLTIASMIEREAQVPAERPLVAAVIYNRLRAHMPLGIDATLRYGLRIPPTQSITESELASDTPYNTRKFPGLPPTPIANPGLASIEAAAHPAHVGYLYFVREPDGRHHYFTSSYQDFMNHEKLYGY